ncbi:MAG: hypothetical protein Q8O74_03805, partial [bacterium]|nr:hypothetical protein [bacterium]
MAAMLLIFFLFGICNANDSIVAQYPVNASFSESPGLSISSCGEIVWCEGKTKDGDWITQVNNQIYEGLYSHSFRFYQNGILFFDKNDDKNGKIIVGDSIYYGLLTGSSLGDNRYLYKYININKFNPPVAFSYIPIGQSNESVIVGNNFVGYYNNTNYLSINDLGTKYLFTYKKHNKTYVNYSGSIFGPYKYNVYRNFEIDRDNVACGFLPESDNFKITVRKGATVSVLSYIEGHLYR